MKGLLKFGLIGVGGYLLYRRFSDGGEISGGRLGVDVDEPIVEPPPAACVPPNCPSNLVPREVPPAPPPAAPFVQPDVSAGMPDDALLREVAGLAYTPANVIQAAARVPAFRMTSDQWKFYRTLSTGVPSAQTDIFPIGDRGYLMTAVEFLEAMHSHGLAGFGGYRVRGT